MQPEKVEQLLQQEYLTPIDVSRILGVSYATVIRRIERGELEHINITKSILTNNRYRIPSRVVRQMYEQDQARGTGRDSKLSEV